MNEDKVHKLLGWYDGDSFSGSTWYDKSGNGNHGSRTGSGAYIFDGSNVNSEFYANGQKVVTGSTGTQILFPGRVHYEHTIFNVCKYKLSGTKRLILQAESYPAGFGHYLSGKVVLHMNIHGFQKIVIHLGMNLFIITKTKSV